MSVGRRRVGKTAYKLLDYDGGEGRDALPTARGRQKKCESARARYINQQRPCPFIYTRRVLEEYK